jgi:DNA replication protein DnaC
MRALSEILTPASGEQIEKFCENHGAFVATHITGRIWSSCQACAAERNAAAAIRKAEVEAKETAARWKAKLGAACIPERFLDRTLQNYVANNEGQHFALGFALAYAEMIAGPKTGRCAIFSGERGTGKTHLAVGIAQHAMGYGKAAVFVTTQRLIRAVRDTWQKNAKMSETEAVRLFTQPDLLILDEVGVQAGSENEKQILFDVMNERYEQRKSTLLLTNLTAKEAEDFLGERIFDRLREDGGRVIAFNWGSHRKGLA